MTNGQKMPQPDDELLAQLKQRLLDEGFPPKRAESLAAALLRPGPPLAEVLGEVESKLDRLTDVLDEFAKHVNDAAESIESAGNAAASSGEKAAAAATQWRKYREAAAGGGQEAKKPSAPSAPSPVAGLALGEAHESGLRHPIHAAEREAQELRDTVAKGESGRTPAILAGAWIMFLIPFVAIVVGVALGVAYFVTRGDGSGGIASALPFSTDELAALPTDNWITNFAPSAGLVTDFRSGWPELGLTHWPLRTSEAARDAGRPRHVDTQTMRIQQHEKHLGAVVANLAAALEGTQPANWAERA